MMPGLLLLYPDIADGFLQYRVARLDGGRHKATTFSPPYAGVAFAWESATTGVELAGPPWGTLEVHIGSDVALAVWQVWLAMQDSLPSGWLSATAWPLLRGVAEFWESKLALDNPGAAPGSPLNLTGVQGPDEYHYPVDNSAYVNVGAVQTLTRAASVGQSLGVARSVWQPWLDLAARIVIPFDEARGYHVRVCSAAPPRDGSLREPLLTLQSFSPLFSAARVLWLPVRDSRQAGRHDPPRLPLAVGGAREHARGARRGPRGLWRRRD